MKMSPNRGSAAQKLLGGLALLSSLALAFVIVLHLLIGSAPPDGLPVEPRSGLLFQVGQIFTLGQPSDFLWYAFAALTVGSAAGVAFSRNIIYSAFSLLGAFMGVAAMYIYLSAPFLAVTQVLIYIGGVLVLILFAVMLTSHIRDVKISNSSIGLGPGLVALVACFSLLAVVAAGTPWTKQPTELVDRTSDIGTAFLSTYLLPFEIASVILLATLIGAIVIARKDESDGTLPKESR
ncbi:MAG: NADH-quinone oxidoreductase subunit J family protein [Deltaproteobacteria bacterium]